MAGFNLGDDRMMADVHDLAGTGATENTFGKAKPRLFEMMRRAEGLPEKTMGKGPKGGRANSLNGGDLYSRWEGAQRRMLQELMGDAYVPNETFAEGWNGVRRVKGNYREDAPFDIFRRWGLMGKGEMSDPANIERRLAELKRFPKWSSEGPFTEANGMYYRPYDPGPAMKDTRTFDRTPGSPIWTPGRNRFSLWDE